MKRSILFMVAALVATPLFAAEDLCILNLKQIRNDKATAVMGQPMLGQIQDARKAAEAAQKAGDTKKCIEETNRALKYINDAQKNQ